MHRIPATVLSLLVLTCACSRIELTDPEALVAPTAVEVSIAAEQTIGLDLDAGANVVVTATQRAIDIGLSVRNADGDILRIDSPSERDGDEFLFFNATTSGHYEIVIFSLDHQQAQASSTVKIEKVASLTDGDKLQIDALRAETDAARAAYEARHAEDPARADELYSASADHYRLASEIWGKLAIDDRRALSFYRESVLDYFLARWSEAENSAVVSLELFKDDRDQAVLHARALHLLGQILIESVDEPDIGRARGVLLQAMQIQRDLDDQFNLAITMNTLGILDYEEGKLISARDRFLEAARIQAGLNEYSEASKTYNNVALIDERRGMVLDALESYDRALQLSQTAGADYGYAVILENSADAHSILGNMEEALLRYNEARSVAEKNGDRLGVAQALDGIGNIYYRLGNWTAAANHLEEALQAHASATERRPLVETRLHLGNTFRSLGDVERAIAEHEIALKLAGRQSEKGIAHLELGRDRKANREPDAATEHLRQALLIADDTGDTILEIAALTERGMIIAESSPEQGIDDLDRALTLSQAFTPDKGQVNTLAALASVHQRYGDPATALSYAEQALSLTRELRSRIGNPRLRYTYSGVQAPTLELVIDLLMDMHAWVNADSSVSDVNYAARALEISDLAHASTLVELMYTAGDSITDAAGQSLRSQHQELRQKLAQVAYLQEQDTGSTESPSSADDRDEALARIAADLDVIEARIHELNPDARQLASPVTLDASGIQQLLATTDSKTTLLEYSLGDVRSFVWAVTDAGITGHELPGRLVIETLAQDVYRQLKQPQQMGISTRLEELGAVLLDPVKEHLVADRVIVIPDGALHYIPFGALEIPGEDRFLLEAADIITLPSASVLAAQRSASQTRTTEASGIAVIADPVFELRDGRFSDVGSGGGAPDQLLAATRLGDARSLLRLPYTAQEADAIGRISGDSDANMTLTGFEANRTQFLTSPLDRFRIIHMASHGLIDAEHPELSSLALSAFDPSGERIYNLVQLDDIYELKLNADMVVLSACDTALGVDVRGEGLIGLVHAFMYAGARSVVGSLWAVQDRATARLMEEFYDNLLNRNMPPAASLRHAQLAIAAERQWRNPYYWAAFVYQGEWQL